MSNVIDLPKSPPKIEVPFVDNGVFFVLTLLSGDEVGFKTRHDAEVYIGRLSGFKELRKVNLKALGDISSAF